MPHQPQGRKPVTLCADDFGLSEGVSRAILKLAGAGRLSATGAMTNRPWWGRLARELPDRPERFAVGLHLNLTLGAPLGPIRELAPAGRLLPFNDLLVRAFTRRLPQAEIEGEIERQLAAFAEVLGRPPAFVDGHQHVHVLPGIRGPLIAALARRGLAGRLWLRDPSDAIVAIMRRGVAAPKALAVRSLALDLRRAAQAAGFATNEGFSGFSDFGEGEAGPLFAAAFAQLGPRPLVMCHPGRVDDELAALDPVLGPRERELAYLASPAFPSLLEERGLRLAPEPSALSMSSPAGAREGGGEGDPA